MRAQSREIGGLRHPVRTMLLSYLLALLQILKETINDTRLADLVI